MSILSLIPILGQVLDRVIPDPEERMRYQLELAKLADAENEREHKELVAQSEVNKVEAGHASVFVAGWRPAIGWGCGVALVYNTLLAPAFGLGVADLSFLQTVLLGMLGIGGMRTLEKVKGVTTGLAPVVSNKPVVAPVKEKKKVLGVKWPF